MLGRVDAEQPIADLMADIGRKARAAAQPLSIASPNQKAAALLAMAEAVDQRKAEILAGQ